jgi:hypothetical protein
MGSCLMSSGNVTRFCCLESLDMEPSCILFLNVRNPLLFAVKGMYNLTGIVTIALECSNLASRPSNVKRFLYQHQRIRPAISCKDLQPIGYFPKQDSPQYNPNRYRWEPGCIGYRPVSVDMAVSETVLHTTLPNTA